MKSILACAAIIVVTAGLVAADREDAPASGSPDPTVLAQWTFDEPSGPDYTDASGRGCDATLEKPAPGVTRARGIHGQALSLRGAHALRARLAGGSAEDKNGTAHCTTRPRGLGSRAGSMA